MKVPQRILKEIQRLEKEPVVGIYAVPKEDNIRHFDVSITGPDGSPYEGGLFKLELYLPEDYPMDPPKIYFNTRIYHPNIDKKGRICLDIIKKNWSPALQLKAVLLSIQSLLNEPNFEDPLDETINKHFLENREDAVKTARSWTLKYASE